MTNLKCISDFIYERLCLDFYHKKKIIDALAQKKTIKIITITNFKLKLKLKKFKF